MAEFLKCLTFDAFWMLTVREFQTENVIHFNVLNKRAEEVKKAISKFNLATQLACVRACVRVCSILPEVLASFGELFVVSIHCS